MQARIMSTWHLMQAYSQGLRERIIEALEAHEEIAERSAVSLSFIDKL
jgi:hypothetical protein